MEVSNNSKSSNQVESSNGSNNGCKRCSKCGVTQPVSEFYNSTTSKDGLRSNCKTCFKSANAAFRLSNPQYSKTWFESNADYRSNWRANHKGIYNERSRNRYRALKNASLKDYVTDRMNEAQILEAAALVAEDLLNMQALYAKAKRLTIETGVKHVVDHIYPLINNDEVCGLHTFVNLQVITHQENLLKGSRIV